MSRVGVQSLAGSRGMALLAMTAILALGGTWWLVSALATPSNRIALERTRNAQVLELARQALVGWAAAQALQPGEDNPGRLPCPEAAGYIGTSNEGIAAGNCSLPSIGRLPWRTLGLDKLLDTAGQPLWYVVSPGWALPTVSSNLTINSNTAGQLKVDNVAGAAVALVIAPGEPLNAQSAASGGETWCNERTQKRGAATPDYRDYLECQNVTLTDTSVNFATTQAAGAFNDQVLVLRTNHVLPAIEAAIAKRIERDIIPALKSVYATSAWGLSTTNPVFPFAVPFENSGTSTFQGVAGTTQGLLPFNETACTPDVSNPRCLPALVGWAATPASAYKNGGFGYVQTINCSWTSADVRTCTGEYHEDDANPTGVGMRLEMEATFTNVAMGLRAIDATKLTVEAKDDTTTDPWVSLTPTYSVTINDGSTAGKPAGSATVVFGATLPVIDAAPVAPLPSWGTYADFRISIDRGFITDHPLLSSVDATSGWFVRNEWYRLLYYATAAGHAASTAAPRSCEDTTPTCLQVANLAPLNKQRAVLILAGRSLSGAARPNATLADFLDTTENTNLDASFQRFTVSGTFNDRFVSIDENP